MRPLDFSIMMLCCLAWAGNFVVGAWAVSHYPVPPFLLATVRAAIVVALTGGYLFVRRPEKFGLLLCICALAGFFHLGFLYTGLQTASASSASILSQMLTPLATLLSVIFLGEKIGWVRSIAIAGALFGVVFMVYEPSALNFDFGLIYILMAYVSLAIASVLMKRINVDWKIYVAWTSLLLLIGSAIASALFETDHLAVFKQSYLPLMVAAGYAAVFVAIFAHGQYFRMLQKYDVSIVVPLTLTTTVYASILGVVLLDEVLSPRYIFGALIIMPCVFIIARRQKSSKTAPEMIEP